MSDLTKQTSNRAMNPWVLHLQKLGLELKCPLCLNLFKGPVLFPCNHLFCDSCVVRSTEFGSKCPICQVQYANRDLRPLIFMENILGIYRSLDAAFSANLYHRVEDEIGKNGLLHKCGSQRHGKDKGYETPEKGMIEYNSVGKVDLVLPISQKQVGASQESDNGQINMNHVCQSSLGSPPSSANTKVSENDSSDQSPGSYSARGIGKRNFDDMKSQEKQKSYVLGDYSHLWDSKRQKRLNHGTLDMGVEITGHCQPVMHSQNLGTSNCQLVSQFGGSFGGNDLLPPVPTDLHGNRTICGFCLSPEISEATGQMLHYANGKPVTGDAIFGSNVIHVHSLCIEWAPQVYYVGESVKNLKAEMARGAKLKCSKCGLKGAALGCYIKTCRRSYHVPCAKKIPKCRWDHDNFVMLCPSHSSFKLPNEKSSNANSSVKLPNEKSSNANSSVKLTNENSGNSESTIQRLPTEVGLVNSSPFWGEADEKKEWVFCGSALSSEEKFLLVKFAKNIGATVSKFWKPNVTHVIASTNEKGACTRTLKVLMAISNGKWVLKLDWIRECVKAMHPVNEEPYEISLDNHGCCDGPKTGRLRASDNAPKLFDGFSFHFVGDFVSGYKEDLQNLVVAAGGTILRTKEEILQQNSGDHVQAVQPKMVVVYNLDAPIGAELGEEVSILWQRVNEAQDVASKVGGQVIGHTWLLESIAAYKLQPFVS